MGSRIHVIVLRLLTRRVNNAAKRRPMQATRAPARSQRASRVIAALPVIATTFFMNAMVWRYFRQFKMPRPDAYALCLSVWNFTLHPMSGDARGQRRGGHE